MRVKQHYKPCKVCLYRALNIYYRSFYNLPYKQHERQKTTPQTKSLFTSNGIKISCHPEYQ